MKLRSSKSPQAEERSSDRLIELAYVLSQQNSFEEILRLVAQQTAALLHAETALIMMINPKTRETVKTVIRQGQGVDNPQYHFVQDQISGWLMHFKQSLLCQDIQRDARFAGVDFGALPIKSVIAVMLRLEGIFLGCLIVMNKTDGEAFGDDDLACLDKIAVIAAPYLRNVQKISEYFAAPMPEAALLAKYEQIGLLGKCAKFIELLKAIEAAARCDVRVLLEGQTGTGKELIARAIHRFSLRSDQPFFAIDCGAIPANLIESELFGHVKGAFTGATRDRKGMFLAAHQGTLFMDEINNLPLETQSKLMRVLQEDEIRALGSDHAHQVDVRIISAASASLSKLVEQGAFREDLYYRLLVYPIHVPSIEERRDDISLLANHFLKKSVQQQRKQAQFFCGRILEFMKQRQWPGNVRELENFVERLITLASPDTTVLEISMLPHSFQEEIERFLVTHESNQQRQSLTERLKQYEIELLREALQENQWNQSAAARSLDIPEQTLRYKMNKFGIVKPV